MKQHITVDQFTELTNEQYENFKKLVDIKKGVDSITIGKMIEILDNNSMVDIMIYNNQITYVGAGGSTTPKGQTHEELCDNLWEAVKEVLNED